ncbi:fibrinogen-like YCDxxxxGGGW domain-containing protein [Vibrio owensii]|uniref:fibrinogen-like YCDxxxxGGGW domain-containing protein n=1 Tax=Vibrio owensii TaxID=696485 RepID=UPI003CC5F31E
MMKNKALMALTALAVIISANSVAGSYIIRAKTSGTGEGFEAGGWVEREVPLDWVDVSENYACSAWSPDVSVIDFGVAFNQTRTCKKDQNQTVEVYKEHTFSGESELARTYINNRTEDVTLEQQATGQKVARNLCSDIKARNPGSANGVYTVDLDGAGPSPSRSAYCDMSGGGWTLYDSFGSYLYMTKNSQPAYNKSGINSTGALSSAGYSYYLNAINNRSYTVSPYFMHFFYGSSPYGWIKKTMPTWTKKVKVVVSNQWYGGTDWVSYGGSTRTISPRQGPVTLTFNGGGGRLLMKENGILWVDSVWVY